MEKKCHNLLTLCSKMDFFLFRTTQKIILNVSTVFVLEMKVNEMFYCMGKIERKDFKKKLDILLK